MNESNPQKYYRVCVPLAAFPPPRPDAPATPEPGRLPEVVDAGYRHYNSRVPLTATPEQIERHLEDHLIVEITRNEWLALPEDSSAAPFVLNPVDEAAKRERLIRAYA